MTAPASTMHTAAALRSAAPRAKRDAAQAAAAPGGRDGEVPGFAAHLAREVPSAAATPAARQPSSAPVPAMLAMPAKPAGLANAPLPAAIPDALAPDPAPETGKTLPATRQKSAASPAAFPPAAFPLSAAQVLKGAPARSGEATEPSSKTAADTPEAEAAVLVLALPVAAPLMPPPPPAASPAVASPAATSSPAAAIKAAPAAPRSQPQAPDAAPLVTPISAPAAQMAHPAAFAAASLVLEHDAAATVAESAPNTAAPTAPESTVQTAARAQPSTFAALTGAPEPERPAARKPRAEIETTHAAPLPAPEIAGGLVLAQQTPAQPSFAPGPDASAAPQPLSFDQLVDSIARARDGADQGGPVAVAMRHAEFGRISLRIESDGAGLTVAMTSPDPTFAPAVAAAHAAATSIEVTRAPNSPQAAEFRESASRDPAQGQASGHPGQRHEAPRAPQRSAPRGETSAASARRDGIFA